VSVLEGSTAGEQILYSESLNELILAQSPGKELFLASCPMLRRQFDE